MTHVGKRCPAGDETGGLNMHSPVDPSWAKQMLDGIRLALFHRRVLMVHSHLTVRERVVLYSLAMQCGARGPVGEVGSYLGASACALAAGVHDAGSSHPVVCVDTWQNDSMSEGPRDTWEAFLSNTAGYRAVIRPVRGRSCDVAAQAGATAGAPLTLLFLDGDHSFDAVTREWEIYRPLLARGAVAAFHDIGWAEGVQKAVNAVIRPQMRWCRQLPNLFWGGLA